MGKPTSGGAGGSGGRGRAVAPAPPDRNITITEDGDFKELQTFLGRNISANEIGDMIGAPDGAIISIDAWVATAYFEVSHPNVENMKQQLLREDGKLVLYNDFIMINKDAPKGMGTQIITRQVEAARKLGISSIDLEAGGSPSSRNIMNGYSTWPRLGFDAEIPTGTISRIPSEIKGTMRDNTMLELYRTQAGRDWWRENGRGLDMKFDTDPNSKSSQALAAYNEERRKRSG